MISKPPIDPATALDKLFQVVREEALANPRFARRLLEVTGHTVQFRSEEALVAIDPILVAKQGADEFRATFVSMKPADVKKVAIASGIWSPSERPPKAIGEFVDILWRRACERREDLSPTRREAAE